MTDAAVRDAINGWQEWEDAVRRVGFGAPTSMRVNGRRWASEPGE